MSADDELPPAPKQRAKRPSPTRRKAPRVAEDDDALLLLRCAPFVGLPIELLRLVEAKMTPARFDPGEQIMSQGESGTSLVVICEGKVVITTHDDNGQRHFIDRAGIGAVLGEMALLTGEPRTADATAVTPVSALLLAADKFHRLARKHPQLAVVLSQLIAARLGGPNRDVLAGKTLQGHQIVRRLGRGGMGVVYEAIQESDSLRVALKMMSHRLVYDAMALAQFEREARLIESFDHPNIVRVLGRFSAFHTYFIVMQFCDGDPLDVILGRDGPVGENECRKIVGQLASGLRYAHSSGVIHRDVKPANVLIDQAGMVRLTDFGLARPVADHVANLDHLVVGTPRYMAPEQMFAEKVDHRADWFSLGCVAYELLTGRPLFDTGGVTEMLHRAAGWLPRNGLPAECPPMSKPLRRFVEQCLQPVADLRRPDFDEAASWAGPCDAELLGIV
jgi:CRP-like cAMP-binding protein